MHSGKTNKSVLAHFILGQLIFIFVHFEEELQLYRPFNQKMDESLCGCFSDLGSCCMTIWCPTIQMSLNWAHSRDDDCDLCHCLACVHPLWTRDNIRKKRHVQPDKCVDCCMYCCCTPCAICMDAREIEKLEKERQANGIQPYPNRRPFNPANQRPPPNHQQRPPPPHNQQRLPPNQQPYYDPGYQQYQVPPNYPVSPIPPFQQEQRPVYQQEQRPVYQQEQRPSYQQGLIQSEQQPAVAVNNQPNTSYTQGFKPTYPNDEI